MTIFADFETRGVVDLIKLGITRYALDPLTQSLCFRWTYDAEERVRLWHRDHPWIAKTPEDDDDVQELLARIEDGELFEAHNAAFEFMIWNHVLRREYPEFRVPLVLEQMRCSAAKGSCMSLPRALGEAAKAVKLPHQKLEDGKRLINKLSKPLPKNTIARRNGQLWCEEEAEHRRNWAYCEGDVRAERDYSNYCPEMTERELEYWRIDWRMNARGIALDTPAAKAGLEFARLETVRLNSELAKLTGNKVLKGSQRKPLLAWVNAELEALEVSRMPNTKADTISFMLFGVPTKAGDEARIALKPNADKMWQGLGERGMIVRRVLEICLEVNRTSVAKYRRMLDSVTEDGRLHDIMLYNGADRTGRWAGKGVQPHNFVRGYSKDMGLVWEDIFTMDADMVTVMWGDPLPCLAKACRGALVASEGKELYTADFNAIEARKLAWLSGCAKQLELFRSGGDPYIDMANGIYGLTCDATDPAQIKQFKKEHPTERQMGKKAILGLGYAMGWEKFQATVFMEEGIWLEDDFCEKVVKIYRKEKCPEVPRLWKSVEAAAINAVLHGGEHFAGGDEVGTGAISYFVERDFLHCRLPSGRLLAYYLPEVHTRCSWSFPAKNARGGKSAVRFPSKVGVPVWKARMHAEKLALKQHKTLTQDAPDNFLSPHLSFMGRNIITRQWQRCGTHGGTLVENADQASSRDLLAEAMWRIDSMDEFDLLLSIHDEVIAEADIGTMPLKQFESIMAADVAWAPGMPIAAEGWIGKRLRK